MPHVVTTPTGKILEKRVIIHPDSNAAADYGTSAKDANGKFIYGYGKFKIIPWSQLQKQKHFKLQKLVWLRIQKMKQNSQSRSHE